MPFKKNVIASYISQIAIALVNIITLPLYFKYMGAEAYGLVGIFSMLQVFFNLLDMGMTPTIARETARFNGGAISLVDYRRLFRALEGFFLLVALIGGIAIFSASGYIASDWLNLSALSVLSVTTSIQLMSVIIAMRWMCGLYRGAINGSQKIVWLSNFNLAIAILRFIGVLPLLMFVSGTPLMFFLFQIFVAVVELIGLFIYSNLLLPKNPSLKKSFWSLAPLKLVLKFSMSIAFTTSVWVFITQTDKLILSKILPLAEYGYFSLAVLVASGVMVLSGPIGMVIMPHLSKLEAENNHENLISIYRKTTQLVTILAGAASITIAFNAEQLLLAWTGDKLLSVRAAPILILYALGNGVLSVSAFPYYLQYAKGDLRLHLIGNALFVVLMVPLIIFVSSKYGAIGAGWVWLAINLLSFIAWLPLVHRKFEPGLNFKWYTQDVLIIVTAPLIPAYLMHKLFFTSDSRLIQLMMILFFGLVTLLTSVLSSSDARVMARQWLRFRHSNKPFIGKV
jgi:O-antigen/teichoic acid export membrane protein